MVITCLLALVTFLGGTQRSKARVRVKIRVGLKSPGQRVLVLNEF